MSKRTRMVQMVNLAAAIALMLVVPGAAWAADETATAVAIYTKDNAPAAPKLEDLPLKESVSQYGITWTFDKPSRVGQFVNGDWYVVGETTVRMIDPAPVFGKDVPEDQIDKREGERVAVEDRVRNGSMVNPPPRAEVGFDSGVKNWYKPELNAHLPIKLKSGDALVSSISLTQGQKPSFPYHAPGRRQTGDNSPVRTLAVLTCVAAPLPADAFRPGYADRQQTIYYARNLRRNLLPSLERVRGAPDAVKFADVFQKPWFNTCFFGFEQPAENMARYGQWVCQALVNGALTLCLDYTPQEKERLLVNYVQVGIDFGGLIRAGHRGWEAWGGHGSGRKLPIVFAGYLLGDETMTNISREYPKAAFGEDEQTAYGNCWTGAKVVFTGHSGISSATGLAPRFQWGPYEDLPPEQWQKNRLNGRQSEAYRRANTSNSWVGEALVLRILKLEKAWNHDAFFDYVDRWMTEDDSAWLARINTATGGKPIVDTEGKFGQFSHQGYCAEGWIKEMWNKYRSLSPAPTDGWKKPHDDSYYRNAVEHMDGRPLAAPPDGA